MFKYIDKWMLLLLAVLLTACRSDDKEEIVSPDEDCYLDIYVYAPSRPIVTRSDIGEVMPKDGESTINTLQIWVFRHSDDENAAAVGYLEADPTFLNETGQQKYQLLLEKSFANNPEPVDVYVVANTASVGLSFNEETSRLVLDNAKINEGYFGTGTTISGGITTGLQSTVPSEGLPMSAMAKNQPIYGSFPALRIGPTENETTVLELTRAVSKLRFVLCQIKDQVASKTLVSIDEIKLTDGKAQTPSCQIPTQTYLMPGTYNYSNLVTGEIVYVNNDNKLSAANIPKVVNPLAYAYETQGAQEYEDLIDKAISGEKKANDDDDNLMELGLTYLRESDKQLTGTIRYTYSTGKDQNEETVTETKTANFAIAAPGDFLRNHSWIIYAYYMDAEIHILTVTHIGMKGWTNDDNDESVTVYNW